MAGTGKLMHALQYESYGGGAAGLKHVQVPVPAPLKDEVLIKLQAVSLNPVDWKIQKGMLRPLLPRKFPHIPATDIAGEVVEVGSEVKDFKSGDPVVAMLTHVNGGGLAEFGVAKESLTHRCKATRGVFRPLGGLPHRPPSPDGTRWTQA